jgi:hypothetical protein
VTKDFQGLSPTEEVIAEVSTHLLCKRLHYVLSVNQIHTRVVLSVNQIQTTIYMNLEEPIYLEEPISSGYPAQPGLTWRNRSLPSPTRINLEEPISSGYPAQTGLTWRNRRLPSPTRINLEEP